MNHEKLAAFIQAHPGGFKACDVMQALGWDRGLTHNELRWAVRDAGLIITFDSQCRIRTWYPAGTPMPAHYKPKESMQERVDKLRKFATGLNGGFTSADLKAAFGWDANAISPLIALAVSQGLIIRGTHGGGSPKFLTRYYPAGAQPTQDIENIEPANHFPEPTKMVPYQTQTPFADSYEALKLSLGLSGSSTLRSRATAEDGQPSTINSQLA